MYLHEVTSILDLEVNGRKEISNQKNNKAPSMSMKIRFQNLLEAKILALESSEKPHILWSGFMA
jgi:hypothetical protein